MEVLPDAGGVEECHREGAAGAPASLRWQAPARHCRDVSPRGPRRDRAGHAAPPLLSKSLRIGSAASIALYAVFAQLMLQTAGAFAVLLTVWSGSPSEFWRPTSRSASSPTPRPAVALRGSC